MGDGQTRHDRSVRMPDGRRRRWARAAWSGVLTMALAAVFLVVVPPTTSVAAPCDAPVVNEIACENTKAGTAASEWDINGSGSAAIQGFTTDISVNRGSSVAFKIKSSAASYRVTIYRMGYYGGTGARKITTFDVTNTARSQPACASQASTGLVDCANWAVSTSWAVPATAVSGVYFAQLAAGNDKSHVFFVVRNDASTSDLLFQTSDTTWQAYNSYGGNSLYVGAPANRAYKVSYNRPFNTRDGATAYDWIFNAEYPTIRFLEANGYDLSYTTGVDSDRRGELIRNHKTFLSVGHDEYWSGNQRANVEAARDAGVNLAFWSGNEVFWKTRWEKSLASTGDTTSYRTLVTYKETELGTKIDPDPAWTGTWRDPRSPSNGGGNRPENALTGTMFTVNCCTTQMRVNGDDGKMRLWRNTRAASLAATAETTLGKGILGYEWDESPDNGAQPAGLIFLSTTSENVDSYIQDYGWSYARGEATHHLTLYRAASGALVFGAGSVQWGWGLDDNHDNAQDAPANSADPGGTADVAVQQATVNLLADMGAQPATRQSGLVAATASTDTVAPTSVISSPANGAQVPVNQPVTISGTATDAGGRVGGVEVSIDGGTTWHRAKGRANWSYEFTPGISATLAIRSRATDDSLRMEAPGAGRTVTVGQGSDPGGACPCTIFSAGDVPAVTNDPDSMPIKVGVRFTATTAGRITGIRFYKGTSNTGQHTATLWDADQRVVRGTATFTGETASGWQTAQFPDSGVAIEANRTYIAYYTAPVGRYAVSEGYFAVPKQRGPLTAPQDTDSAPNGVYTTDMTAGVVPTLSYRSSNYWVDVVFSTDTTPDTTKPTITSRTPDAGATGVTTTAAVRAVLSEPMQAGTVALTLRAGGTAVGGTSSYDANSRQVSFTPSGVLAASTTYTAAISGAKDTAGNTIDPVSWTFTTAAADVTAPTVTSRTPASGATGVALSSAVSAGFSEELQTGTAEIGLKRGTTTVAGSLVYDPGTRRATFTPSAALTAGAAYTVTVSGARDLSGNRMTDDVWSFTATTSNPTTATIFTPTEGPSTAADTETRAVELGLRFTPTRAGRIVGLRFYRSARNTADTRGTLWLATTNGSSLGTVTFPARSTAGWQEATFATPIDVTASTTYLASYYLPNGGYHYTVNAFTAALTRGSLTVPRETTSAPNGAYVYATGGGFPKTAYKASNYWVDVVYQPN